MKKIIIITAFLTATLIGYSQNLIILEEDFTANTLPANWYVGNPGNGTQPWTFGSNHVPDNFADYDFSTNAAIFDDDEAGDG
jgi:hypothetical protein